ncbi:MAG: phage head closure protein [Alphaproteobacteria bacterium]|nr:phage head closure protein [Alphaproteobacteria bacterium]
MRIGNLDKRLTLQSESFSGSAAVWATIGSVWAEIKPAGGSAEHITHKIIVRYRSDVATGMRLILGDRVFTVRSIIRPDESGRWLELMVEEGGLL